MLTRLQTCAGDCSYLMVATRSSSTTEERGSVGLSPEEELAEGLLQLQRTTQPATQQPPSKRKRKRKRGKPRSSDTSNSKGKPPTNIDSRSDHVYHPCGTYLVSAIMFRKPSFDGKCYMVKWVGEDNGVKFLFRDTTLEPEKNLAYPAGTITDDNFAWLKKNPNQWMHMGGSGLGRELDANEVEKAKHIPAGAPYRHIPRAVVGTKPTHTDERCCAVNSYFNLTASPGIMSLTAPQMAQFRQSIPEYVIHFPCILHVDIYTHYPHRSAHIKLLKQEINNSKQSVTPHELIKVPFQGKQCTDLCKIQWLLSLREGDASVPHTGKLLVGIGTHVIGWDAWNGLVYDPDPNVGCILPATPQTVKALRMENVHSIVRISYKNVYHTKNKTQGA